MLQIPLASPRDFDLLPLRVPDHGEAVHEARAAHVQEAADHEVVGGGEVRDEAQVEEEEDEGSGSVRGVFSVGERGVSWK